MHRELSWSCGLHSYRRDDYVSQKYAIWADDRDDNPVQNPAANVLLILHCTHRESIRKLNS